MRGIIFFLFTTVTTAALLGVNFDKNEKIVPSVLITKTNSNNKPATIKATRLKNFGNNIRNYAKKNNFNSELCFLVDMKLPSGSKRFFIYDLKKDSVLDAGLVAHGSGSDSDDKGLIFFNTINSNATSLGKYKIGNAYYGKFGLAYKLHGLDKTNSKAFNRFVVLHSHSCVPENEVTPIEICRSWGCPTVAPSFLAQLKKYLDNSDKPILLQIFY
jgi:hypothetical protein